MSKTKKEKKIKIHKYNKENINISKIKELVIKNKKNIIFTLVISTILITTLFIFVFSSRTNRILIQVMNSERTFIDSGGNELLFENYKVYGVDKAYAEKYTFVDLDSDGVEELTVLTTSDYGAYMIFRYDKQTKRTYGYLLGVRSLQDLKIDGIFSGSGGAGVSIYCKMEFHTNNMETIELAYKDSDLKKYRINQKDVTEDEINEFVSDFNKKENCLWETKKIKNIEPPKENNNNNNSNNNNNNNKENLVPISLNDYVTVTFSGKDLAGYATAKFDKEQFMLDHINHVSFNEENLQVYRELYGYDSKSAISSSLRFVSVSVKPSYDLSNGDKVEIVWIIDEEKLNNYFNCNYEYSAETFVVTGLTEPATFNPFDELQVSYSGIAPYGSVKVYSAGRNYGGTYTVTPDKNLKNGDKIIVKYNCDDKATMVANYGKYPSVYENTYTVSGLKEYPLKISDISNEILSNVDKLVQNYFSNYKTDAEILSGQKFKSAKVAGYAFLIPTAGDDSLFFAVYEAQLEGGKKIYMMFQFYNPIIENGVCKMATHQFYGEAEFDTIDGVKERVRAYMGNRYILQFETYK